MKTLFVEARYSKEIKLDGSISEKLPGKVGLVSSVQFMDSLALIKKQLRGRAVIGGQVLGCDVRNAEKIRNRVEAFLYIGDGKFHPMGIAIKTKKMVFTFNPYSNSFKKIEKKDIEDYEKRRKAAMVKFLHADNVGVLVSAKKGQYYDIKKLASLEKRYKNKRFYRFIADTIDYRQLENFPFIDAWVNTACPRIEEDIRAVNIDELVC
ncbi:2-(3-amino-3-carboxypropyl)histidine synthase subunit [Candidatus Woesearchaeota archaeon]|nr:2-(3-amino-3-carboxypropyl)histidine synthase subunit [Candidatus Woesearchaeota archaeon]